MIELIPAPASWKSSFFEATVAGMVSDVYQKSQVSGFANRNWNAGEEVVVHWIRFGADQDTTIILSTGSAEISSAVVYPPTAARKRIIGGRLYLLVKPQARLYVVVNGDKKNPLIIASLPLKQRPTNIVSWTSLLTTATLASSQFTCAAKHNLNSGDTVTLTSTGTLPSCTGGSSVPAGVLSQHERYAVTVIDDWTFSIPNAGTISGGTGTLTVAPGQWTGSGSALYFPAGEHKIGRLFKLGNSCTLYLDKGAVVTGSYDFRNRQNLKISGYGITSCTYATRADVVSLPFEQQVLYAAVLGYDSLTFTYNNEIDGILFVSMPFYFTHEGINVLNNCQLIAPWEYNCDGIDLSSGPTQEAYSKNCITFLGDDSARADSNWFSMKVEDCLLINTNASGILLGYWGSPNGGKRQELANCDLVSFTSFSENIRCWIDCANGNESWGRFNIRLTNINVWGTTTQLFRFENFPYPFGGAKDSKGQMAFVYIDGLNCEKVPENKSRLIGYDAVSTMHDFTVTKMVVAGVRVFSSNWRNYVEQNSFPYNIVLDTEESALQVVEVDIDPIKTAIERLLSGWTFPQAVYANGKLSAGPQISASQITVGRIKADQAQARIRKNLQGSLNRMYRADLSFVSEAIVSGLEQILSDDPLIMPGGVFGLIDSVEYQHPPIESPNRGTVVSITFLVTDYGKGSSLSESTRAGLGATSGALKVAIQNAIYAAVEGEWQQTTTNEVSSRFGPSRRKDKLRLDRISWDWTCELQAIEKADCRVLEQQLCDSPITVAIAGSPTLFAAAVGFDYSDPPTESPNRGSTLTITFSVSTNP